MYTIFDRLVLPALGILFVGTLIILVYALWHGFTSPEYSVQTYTQVCESTNGKVAWNGKYWECLK